MLREDKRLTWTHTDLDSLFFRPVLTQDNPQMALQGYLHWDLDLLDLQKAGR